MDSAAARLPAYAREVSAIRDIRAALAETRPGDAIAKYCNLVILGTLSIVQFV